MKASAYASFFIFLIGIVLIPRPGFSFEFLSEFISSSGAQIRESTSSLQSSDVITTPSWVASSMPLNMRLCVGGTAINNATFFQDNPGTANRNAELLADVNAAIDEWQVAASGTGLEINNIGSASAGCGPNIGVPYGGDSGDSAGSLDLFFNNVFDTLQSDFSPWPIPTDVVAFTILTLELSGGVLRIKDADIVFNTAAAFATGAYIDANDPSRSLTDRFSFRGVLTHELGHFLGLAHSLVIDKDGSGETNQVTMFPAVSSLGQTMDLESNERDDIVAIKTLYEETDTFSGSQYGGSISGVIRQPGLDFQRGAQVVAYSVTNNQTLVARMSGMTGNPLMTDGAYEIKGLPLNEEFIVYVEPALRTSIHPNFQFNFVNTPMIVALNDQDVGLSSFNIEAYPDVGVSDVRASGNLSSAPGIENATKFTLTSSSSSQTGVDFFVSNAFEASNDAYGVNLEITNPSATGDDSTLIVTNAAPLQVSLSALVDMSDIDSPSLTITAIPDGEGPDDWSDSASSFSSLISEEALFTLGSRSNLSSGSFTITAILRSGSTVVATDSRSVTLNEWTNTSPSLVFGESLQAASGGGGGCQVKTHPHSPAIFFIAFLLLALVYAKRRFTLQDV